MVLIGLEKAFGPGEPNFLCLGKYGKQTEILFGAAGYGGGFGGYFDCGFGGVEVAWVGFGFGRGCDGAGLPGDSILEPVCAPVLDFGYVCLCGGLESVCYRAFVDGGLVGVVQGSRFGGAEAGTGNFGAWYFGDLLGVGIDSHGGFCAAVPGAAFA